MKFLSCLILSSIFLPQTIFANPEISCRLTLSSNVSLNYDLLFEPGPIEKSRFVKFSVQHISSGPGINEVWFPVSSEVLAVSSLEIKNPNELLFSMIDGTRFFIRLVDIADYEKKSADLVYLPKPDTAFISFKKCRISFKELGVTIHN